MSGPPSPLIENYLREASFWHVATIGAGVQVGPETHQCVDREVETRDAHIPSFMRRVYYHSGRRAVAIGIVGRWVRSYQFQWTPYEDPTIRVVIPVEFFQNLNIWHVKILLVNYAIVERHQSDRVLWQFRFRQPITVAPEVLDDEQKVDLQ
ncbi:hypothetical protein J1N35_033613 [Gossypium stocksii]|uniref:Aminotransferase-like plant mobile domain-containing protein n=1 Tax=Gossypium stocksii TaxID=47602 RepID=A0A9D3UQE6_9ROSI|nr:hypothetical protein J1N35_033613 [Gossypium stocksii]